MAYLKDDMMDATPPAQTCTGQKGGLEASIHTTRLAWEDKETQGIVFVDATNAYNNYNRKNALHNIQYTCPHIHTLSSNFYRGG